MNRCKECRNWKKPDSKPVIGFCGTLGEERCDGARSCKQFKPMGMVLDRTLRRCHVCGFWLVQEGDREYCSRPACQVGFIRFNMPAMPGRTKAPFTLDQMKPEKPKQLLRPRTYGLGRI